MRVRYWVVAAGLAVGACAGGDDAAQSSLVRISTSQRSYPRSGTARLTIENTSDHQLGIYFGSCTYLERKNGGDWSTDGGSPPPAEPCAAGSPVVIQGRQSVARDLNVGGMGGDKRFVTSIQIRDSAIAGGASPHIPRSESRSNEFRVD